MKPAPATSDSEGLEDDLVTMSLFEVNAERDEGYAASDTLGGTRLRTELKDVAASISVVTKEMMNDLAADDMTRLANYTLSSEVIGIEGNYSGASNFSGGFMSFDGVVAQSQPQVRLRGLDAASRTRDYFLTDIPEDSYNMDRSEVQRGPNGMLYGLGSPAGVINSVSAKPNLQRTRTNIGTRFGSYGTYRISIDHNQALIKDKLAVRLAALRSQTEYQIEEPFNEGRRVYAAITYKPFVDTTIRVSGEMGQNEGIAVQNRPPYDASTYWWESGKPVYNAQTNTFSFSGTPPPVTPTGFNGNPNQFLVNFQHRGNNPSLVIEDPLTGAYGLSVPGNPQAMELATNRLYRNAANTAWINGQIFSTSRADAFIKRFQTVGSYATGFFLTPMISDPDYFDFFNHQLDGRSYSTGLRWGSYNIILEQRLGKNAGIEVGFDHQDSVSRGSAYTSSNRYTLNIDVTSVLADGNVNPNFGRPFMADTIATQTRDPERDAFRATAYYDFDSKRVFGDTFWGKLIGRHTFTTNYSAQKKWELWTYGYPHLDMAYYNIVQAQNAGTATVANVTSNSQRQLNVVTYLGPSLMNTDGPHDVGITGLRMSGNPVDRNVNTVNLRYHPVPPAATTVPTSYQTGMFNVIQPRDKWDATEVAWQGTKTKDDFESVTLIGQDRWLDNHLITTWGWRRDWVRTYNAGSSKLDSIGNLLTDDVNWPLRPNVDDTHDAFNYGIVLHVPRSITKYLGEGTEIGFLYNNSDNFTPMATRLNVFGNDIKPTVGETEDYGVTVGLLHGKIRLRVSHYDSASRYSTNNQFTNGVILAFDRTMGYQAATNVAQGTVHILTDGTDQSVREAAFFDFLRSPEGTAFYNDYVTGFHVDENGNVIGAGSGTSGRVYGTSDVDAEGWEYELTANPTKSWRITLNVAEQKPVLSNSGNDIWEMIESWYPYLVDTAAGDLVYSGTNPAGTTIEQFYLNTRALAQRIRATDGAVSPEVRRWRFNLVTRYSFSTGFLKGWNVGGAYRWQDEAAIGYHVIADDQGVGIYDVNDPFYGPEEKNVDAFIGYSGRIFNDKVRWNAQLNVRNIGVGDKLIKVSVNPDGMPNAYRIAAAQQWTISNSFEF